MCSVRFFPRRPRSRFISPSSIATVRLACSFSSQKNLMLLDSALQQFVAPLASRPDMSSRHYSVSGLCSSAVHSLLLLLGTQKPYWYVVGSLIGSLSQSVSQRLCGRSYCFILTATDPRRVNSFRRKKETRRDLISTVYLRLLACRLVVPFLRSFFRWSVSRPVSRETPSEDIGLRSRHPTMG